MHVLETLTADEAFSSEMLEAEFAAEQAESATSPTWPNNSTQPVNVWLRNC